MLGSIFKNINFSQKVMDACWLRNEVIAQNIANAETPGYKRKELVFEELLSEEIKNQSGGFRGTRTNPRHIPIGGGYHTENVLPQIVEDDSNTAMRLDGNSVDIEREMALMAKNTIQYAALTQRVSGQLSSLKNVIKEGR